MTNFANTINNILTVATIFVFVLTFSTNVQAQEEIMFTASRTAIAAPDAEMNTAKSGSVARIGAFGEIIDYKSNIETASEYYRKPQLLETNYTGISVQLIASEQALDTNHDVFQQFGNVKVGYNEGQFTYLITNFEDTAAANDFIKKVLKGRFPNAKVVNMENGQEI